MCWTYIQQAITAEVITPIHCESNHQDAHDPGIYVPPPRRAMEMIRTKDNTKRNGWMKALKKEIKAE
jgi:hypothetical protein